MSVAQGNYSHVEGRSCGVEGVAEYGHAEGFETFASSPYQHVQGRANVPDGNSTYCDIIGNGISHPTQESNAYNMDWNGNAEFQGEVYVGGCTPNGETPYPVVRYNTSNSKQEYYDKANSQWAQVPGGGGGGWTSLWTNSSPNNDYAAGTEAIDLSGYSLIAVLAKTSTSGTGYNLTFMQTDGNTYIITVGNTAGTQYWYKRSASANSTGITFSTGYRNTTSTAAASYCIPVAVYGVA